MNFFRNSRWSLKICCIIKLYGLLQVNYICNLRIRFDCWLAILCFFCFFPDMIIRARTNGTSIGSLKMWILSIFCFGLFFISSVNCLAVMSVDLGSEWMKIAVVSVSFQIIVWLLSIWILKADVFWEGLKNVLLSSTYYLVMSKLSGR